MGIIVCKCLSFGRKGVFGHAGEDMTAELLLELVVGIESRLHQQQQVEMGEYPQKESPAATHISDDCYQGVAIGYSAVEVERVDLSHIYL